MMSKRPSTKSKFSTGYRPRPRSYEYTFINDFQNVISHFLANPFALLSVILSVAIAVSHKEYSTSVLGKALLNSTNPIAIWINTNSGKFIGMTVFVPAVFSVPHKMRTCFVLAFVAWVFLMPLETYLSYSVMSLSVVVYFRATLLTTRIVVLITMFSLVTFEFFKFKF